METPRQECLMTVVKATVSEGNSYWEWGEEQKNCLVKAPSLLTSSRVHSHGWLARPNGIFSKSFWFISRTHLVTHLERGRKQLEVQRMKPLSNPFISIDTFVCFLQENSDFSRLFMGARHDMSSSSLSWCYAWLCSVSLTEKPFG